MRGCDAANSRPHFISAPRRLYVNSGQNTFLNLHGFYGGALSNRPPNHRRNREVFRILLDGKKTGNQVYAAGQTVRKAQFHRNAGQAGRETLRGYTLFGAGFAERKFSLNPLFNGYSPFLALESEDMAATPLRSEEHTSELQSRENLV